MKILSWSLPVLIVGFLIAGLFSQGSQMVDATVNIDVDQASVSVNPDTIEIGLGDQVRWSASGAAEGTLRIDFDESRGLRGPFRARGSGDNPERGRYAKNVRATIVTEGASDAGEWKYTITWIQPDGQEIILDPRVVVRGG